MPSVGRRLRTVSAPASTDTSRSTRSYVAAVTIVAAAAFAAALYAFGLPDHLSWWAALFVVGFVAAVGRPQAIGSVQVSVSGIVQIAAIPLVGPVGASLVAIAPVVLDRKGATKGLFNAAQRMLLVLAGAGAYRLAGL